MKHVYDVGLEVEFSQEEEERLEQVRRERADRRPQRDLVVRREVAPEAEILEDVLGWRP